MTASEKDMIRLTKDFYRALNRDNLSPVSTILADHAELVDTSSGTVYRGPDEALTFYRNSLTAFPDMKVDVEQQIASGNTVVNVIRLRGTHKGPLRTPDGSEIPATEKKIDYKCCEVWEFQGDKAVSVHLYADLLGPMQQMGLAPQPGARIVTQTAERRYIPGSEPPRHQPGR